MNDSFSAAACVYVCTRSLPAMSSAIFFASAAVLARPNLGVGTPASWDWDIGIKGAKFAVFLFNDEHFNIKCIKNGFENVEMSQTLRRLMETCSCTDNCLCCCTPETTAGNTWNVTTSSTRWWMAKYLFRGAKRRQPSDEWQNTFFGEPSTETPFTLCSKEAILAVSENN